MGYSALKNSGGKRNYAKNGLEDSAIRFIRERCENLRFDDNFKEDNQKKDIDRLCLENSIAEFLKSGKKDDAFNVYFCYLEMFIGDYDKTRRMIELLSEFEANGSCLLMKHRDHYSHSVYVFILGLAIYENNCIYREIYKKFYHISDENKAAHHYLQYWGLASLFHDIGYPFELPFEQVCSYFEVEDDDRTKRPFVSYSDLDNFIKLDKNIQRRLSEVYDLGVDEAISDMNELFAYLLMKKLSLAYYLSEKELLDCLRDKPTKPNKFGHFMDHAYFSAILLFKKLFCELHIDICEEYMDALSAIILHNSLYKFSIAYYKNKYVNIPFKAELHPLAYMLMLCDELQCWDRTAYGRNSRLELHPMNCVFDFTKDTIIAEYIYDKNESTKIKGFKADYIAWKEGNKEIKPKLKAYSGMHTLKENETSDFLLDIQRIVCLDDIKLEVRTKLGTREDIFKNSKRYLSDSSFINLYNFAQVLNGRWSYIDEWKNAKAAGKIDEFVTSDLLPKFSASFKKLSLEYKLSNINQAKAFAGYMQEIGCFYTDRAVDFEMVEKFTESELQKIGVLEHKRWLQEHIDMGWVYDAERSDAKRQHKDMIPYFDYENESEVTFEQAKKNYDRLEKSEQDKDTEPMECMISLLKVFDGIRIYRI